MTQKYIISGTDTGIGKTVVSAMLTQELDAYYWKPLQSGLEDGKGDKESVQEIAKIAAEKILPEAYILNEPLSPHRAAELDEVEIDLGRLMIPQCDGPLIIEGAGGLMVPINRQWLQIDQFKTWALPVILVCRTGLGTINHTLLSIEAMKARAMKIHGLIFVGEDNPDNIKTICEFSGQKKLGYVPVLPKLTAQNLQEIFKRNFTLSDFLP